MKGSRRRALAQTTRVDGLAACRRCTLPIALARWIDAICILGSVVFAGVLAKRWALLGADPPNWQVWGVALVAVVPWGVARAIWPKPFHVTFKRETTVYEFANADVAETFATLNGGSVE